MDAVCWKPGCDVPASTQIAGTTCCVNHIGATVALGTRIANNIAAADLLQRDDKG